jgi:magnesium-transporting ATPase (P-type)
VDKRPEASPAEPSGPKEPASTLYPIWRFIGIFVSLLAILPLITFVVLLFDRKPAPGIRDAGFLRTAIFGLILALGGGMEMVNKPARGFLVFGASFFICALSVLVYQPCNAVSLQVMGFFMAAGLLYTGLGAKQLSADRVSS